MNESAADAARAPQLSIIPNPGGSRTVRFEFNNPPDRSDAVWQVESTPSLDPAAWQPLAHGVGPVSITRTGDTVRVEIVEKLPLPAQRYLRLRGSAP